MAGEEEIVDDNDTAPEELEDGAGEGDQQPEGQDDAGAPEAEPEVDPEQDDDGEPEATAPSITDRERAIAAEAVADELRRMSGSNTNNARAEQARREREEKLALMTPEEKTTFLTNESIQTMRQEVLLTKLQTADAMDKHAYNMIAQNGTPKGKVYAKWGPEVERRLAKERNEGRNPQREQLLAQIIGENALKGNTVANVGKKKAAAQARVGAAKSSPVTGRSNVSSGSKTAKAREDETLEELEERLADVHF